MKIDHSDALVVVDVQNDFFHGGALPVNDAHKIIPVVNSLLRKFDHVVFTRDWHPLDHCSFAEDPEFRDGSWPVHCTADSAGAEFHGDVHVPVEALIVSKGTTAERSGYSAFEGTTLAQYLRKRNIKRIMVCGLATDFCIKATALDGIQEGFEVILIENGCCGVDNPEGEVAASVEEMRKAQVQIISSGDLE